MSGPPRHAAATDPHPGGIRTVAAAAGTPTRPRGATTTTYLAAAALDQLDHAQAQLQRHLVTRPDGRCVTCLHPEPCPARTAASATFARYGRLPRRQPGTAHPAMSAAPAAMSCGSISPRRSPTAQ